MHEKEEFEKGVLSYFVRYLTGVAEGEERSGETIQTGENDGNTTSTASTESSDRTSGAIGEAVETGEVYGPRGDSEHQSFGLGISGGHRESPSGSPIGDHEAIRGSASGENRSLLRPPIKLVCGHGHEIDSAHIETFKKAAEVTAAPTPGTSEALASAQKVIEAWDKANQAGESTPGQEDAILEYQDLLIYFDYDKNEGNIALALAREVQRLSALLKQEEGCVSAIESSLKFTKERLDKEYTEVQRLKEFELRANRYENEIRHLREDVLHPLQAQLAAVDQAWVSVLREHCIVEVKYPSGGRTGWMRCECGATARWLESFAKAKENFIKHLQAKVSEHLNTKGQTK